MTEKVSVNSYVSYMATQEEINQALRNNIISEATAALLQEYNERLQSNNVPIIYNLRHLRKILHIRKKEQNKYFGSERNEYHCFKIPKKSGGMREIEAPSDILKSYQSWIKVNILDKIAISDYAMGFKKSCSILDNAKKHVGKELVINLDIKDFFPSITYKQVYKIFSYLGYTNEVAHLLTQICTNKDNVLPQGSPASPIISNIVALKLDKRLSGLADSFECDYSRYADDITFSGSKCIKRILPLVKAIIEEEGFEINADKLRFQYSFQRQEVTGLVVNEGVKISPRLQHEIEYAIYYCKKYGVENHMSKIGCTRSFYKEHLYGIAYFVKMINCDQGEYYLKQLDLINWAY